MKSAYLIRLFALTLILGTAFSSAHAQTFEVTAPAGVAGTYNYAAAAFGPRFTGFTGQLVEAFDANGATTGCAAIVTDVTGAVALIDRGACPFANKAFAAEAAGAIGVVLCNNDVANPDAVIIPGGTDGCQLTIPTIMLSYNDCQALRMETGVIVNYDPGTPEPGYEFETAISITDGTYTVDSIPVNGNTFTNATGELWYAYTAPANGLLNISSCGSNVATRLIVTVHPLGCRADLNIAGSAVSGCAPEAGSNLDLLVFEGVTYYLVWDNAGSSAGFDFSVTLNDLPVVDVTFNVNMEAETVSVDGVQMVYAGPGASSLDDVSVAVLSDDDGDGVWSATIQLTSLDTIGYAFVNGNVLAGGAVESVPNDCGLDGGFGFNVRPYILTSANPVTVPAVCYSLCTNCPIVDVTFTVDMTTQVVSGDGVQMVYAGPGATSLDDVTVLAMGDNGDGTWSVTATLMTGDTIGYAFVNGNVLAGGAVESVPSECGLDGGFGFNIRPFIVQGFADYSAGKFCFSSCAEFCELDCSAPLVLISDDFESYTAGQQPTGTSYIIPWPGTTSLGLISNDFAFSGNNSHRITGTGSDVDPVYLLGNQTEGHFIVSWRMYVPAGSSAYYNFQKSETPGTQWAFQLHFDPDGMARLEAGSTNAANPRARFAYAPNTWLNIQHIIDLDNNIARVLVNNQLISSWPYNWQPFATTGTLQLGGVNFYPTNTSFLYYIDDFYFARIPDAADGLYCQAATEITPGVHSVEEFSCFGGGLNVRANGVNGARAAWFTYTPDEDGWISVSSCGSESDTRAWVFTGDCYALTTLGVNDDRCEQSNGDPYASYREVPVSAGTTYYIMWDNVWDNTGFEFELAFSTDDLVPGNFCQSAIEVTPGIYSLESFGDASVAGPRVGFLTSSTTPYAGATWYSYTADADGKVNINACLGDDTDTYLFVYTGTCDNFNTLQLVASNDDACGASSEVELDVVAGTTYYIEWIDRFSGEPFEWELRAILPADVCSDAFDINNLFGAGVGNLVSAGPYDNTNYTVSDADPDFGWECFGEPDGLGGAPSLERTMWFSFVGDGNTYFIEALGCGTNPITDNDTQMAIYSGSSCDDLTAVACSEDGPNAASSYYPAGLELETEEGVVYYMMIDGFGPDFEAIGEYCVEVTQLTTALVTVTFQVDAQILVQTGELHPEGMFIAGAFSNFENVAMSDTDGDNVWTAEIAVNPGAAYTYKFKNGPDGWESIDESIGGPCTVGGFGDREVTVGDADLELDVVCFGYCVTCNLVSVNEESLMSGVKVFPNPAKELLNVNIDLSESASSLTIRMYNVFGQLVSQRYLGQFQTGNIELDVRHLPAGAYMIQIMDGKAQFTQTVIVE